MNDADTLIACSTHYAGMCEWENQRCPHDRFAPVIKIQCTGLKEVIFDILNTSDCVRVPCMWNTSQFYPLRKLRLIAPRVTPQDHPTKRRATQRKLVEHHMIEERTLEEEGGQAWES